MKLLQFWLLLNIFYKKVAKWIILDEVRQLGIVFAGLDPKLKKFGFSSQKFMDFYFSANWDLEGCSMLRKGVSIEAATRPGPHESIVLNPCNSNSNQRWHKLKHPRHRSFRRFIKKYNLIRKRYKDKGDYSWWIQKIL